MSEPNTNNTAQLGCGTLIIIALIVMVFSGGRESKELRQSVNALNAKLDRLEKKIDALTPPLIEQRSAPAKTEDNK
jgi:outer membrane murein-binding lipoprotein Lpp